MFSPNRRRPRGWLSIPARLWEGVVDFWDRLRHNVAKLFDFRWLSARLSGIIDYVWWGMRYPFIVIGWLLQQLWSVLVAWWQIRNFRFLIQGLPALLAIIFVIIVAAYTALRSDDGIQELYIRQGTDAYLRSDRSRARLCYERLMQLQYVGDPRRLETQFRLGKIAAELNQPQRARALLSELANPDNDEGYVDAHLERARAIFAQSRRTREDMLLIEKHLRRALKKQPDNKEVNAYLGQILSLVGRNDEAIPFLLKSRPDDVEARLTLGRIYKMQGNKSQAALFIDPIIKYLEEHASGEIDDVRYRSTLANAYIQMEQFEDAIKTLETGYQLKNSEYFRFLLSNCYLNWFSRLATMPTKPDRERQKLDCLVQALRWDGTNVQAMNLFVQYMSTAGNDAPARDTAHRLLMTLRGNNAYLHLWLGEKLLAEGKIEEAAKEWDLAFKLHPDCAIIANNFAWILTQGSQTPIQLNPDLLKAERIIEQVLARTPPEDKNKPYYHGTRGTIYLKMGRYEEARRELVLATQRAGADNDINLHRQLAEVYDRLRMPTMADNHRKIVAEIFKRNNRAEPGAQ